jgi:Obg family GTPase CgtA-like protein
MKYWQHKIPLDTKDNIIRFNQKLANLNVEEKIKEMGGSRGDTMILNGEELTVD